MADAVGAGSADGPAAAVAVGPSSAPPSRWRRWAAELGIPFGAFVVIEWALAALIGVLVIGAVLRGTAPTAPAAAPSFAKADQPITDAGAPTADSPARRMLGGAWFDLLGGGAAGSNPFDSDTPNGAADAASTAPGTSIATIAGTTGSTVSAGQPAATGAPPAGASGAPSGSVRVRFGPSDQFSRPGDDDGPRGTAAGRDPRHGAEHHRRPGRSAGGRDAATGDGHPDHRGLHDASDDAPDRHHDARCGDADDQAAGHDDPDHGAVDDAAGSDDSDHAAADHGGSYDHDLPPAGDGPGDRWNHRGHHRDPVRPLELTGRAPRRARTGACWASSLVQASGLTSLTARCASSSMAEQWTLNPLVLGSNPRGRTRSTREYAADSAAVITD